MKLPADDERHAIMGRTGSGKTVFGLWQLAQRSYNRMPWVILDFKADPTIERIPRMDEIDIENKPPKHRGLYVTRPLPADVDDGHVTRFLYDCWARENIGIFIDEGYSIKQLDKGLRAVLTQGRSKRVPIIALSQRPSWISPFILSEADHLSVFYLQTPADLDRMKEWLPSSQEVGYRVDPYTLPAHHSYWYSVKSREFRTFGPCPNEEEILDMFDRKRVSRWII